MFQNTKTTNKLTALLLVFVMLLSLVPGMSLTAYAASTTVTWNASDIVPEHPWDESFTKDGITITAATCDFEQLTFGGGGTFTTTLGNFTKIEISADYAGDVSGTGWSNDGWQSATWTGDAASVSFSGDIWGGGMTCDGGNLTIVFTIATVPVTGVTLDKIDAQTIDVGGKVAFTATVAPDGATDKTVKWSVGGTDAGAVKLYTDEACTTEVGADATDKLTVYAQGESAGSATITATSNADSEKKASCDVTVNAAQTQTEELLTTITATGDKQASYSTANVATVSFSYTAGGSSAYLANWGWWGYGWSATVNAAEGYTITKCVFYDDANRTATDSSSPFVVETTEEDKTPRINGTPIDGGNYQSKGIKKIEVYGYVTPSVVSTVTLNTNGGIINAGNVTEYTEGTGATLPTDVTKNNYTFGGWYDNSGLKGDAVEAISSSDTGDKEFWAKWTMNGEKQIFVKLRDGATKTVNVDMTDTIAVVKQKASDLFECAYEKMFLIFAGKLLDDDTKTLEQCNIQKESTLHLIVGYFVTFESNGGSAVAGKPVSENATMIAPDDPTKEDHTFGGWYKEPELTNAWDFDNDTVTEDITLYAKWTENPNITELTFSGYNGDYDTNGHGAVVTGDTSNYTIRYSTDGVEYTFEQTPTYTAVSQHTIYYQVTRDGYKTLIGSVEIVIGKATPSYTVPTDLVATYGDTLSSISLPTGWAWADNTASVGNAGTNTFAATFTPEDTANYNTVEQNLSVTVGKATPSYTVPTDLVATYGDTLSSISLPTGWAWTNGAQSVGNAGTNTFKATFTPTDTTNYNTVTDIDVTVTVGKADPSYEVPTGLTAVFGNLLSSVLLPDGWSWTNPLQSVGNAIVNTFKAIFTPADTANYKTVENIDVDVTVNKADIAPTVSLEGWTYGETAKPPVVSGNPGEGTVTYTYAVKGNNNFSATVPTNAGTYTVKATIAATANYNGATATADFTIAKADITPTVSLEGWAYGATAKTPVVTGNSGNGAVSYTYAVKGGEDFSATVPTNAGTYTVKATVAATENYNGGTATADFTIAKADINPTVSLEGWTYGQAANAPSVSGNSGNGAVSYTYAVKGSEDFSATVPTNAGTYTVKATIAVTANYANAVATTNFTIAKADATPATVTANKLTCDGKEQALVTAGGEAKGGEMLYALGKDAETAPEDGWSTDVPAATNTGTYYVWYKVVADDNHNAFKPSCVEVTIDPDYTVKEVTGLSGNDKDEWTKGGEDGVIITVKDSGEDNSFDHFTGVKLDDQLLTKDVDYTVKKGSTIVTLLPATLEKLSVGEHTVTVLFDNGEVNTDLTVKAANSGSATSPQTGDNSHMGLWIAIMILSLCALAATLFIGKKKRVFER